MAGCHRSGNASIPDRAQDEFVRAFLTAHDTNDLYTEDKPVNSDDVTDSSRSHFIGELKIRPGREDRHND